MASSKGATPQGTRAYADRFPELKKAAHFRLAQGLTVSSIGLGTYLGPHNETTDTKYCESVKTALQTGCNLFDSAINYRFQRSERAIGRALKELIGGGEFKREEIVIATKGGFIPFDGEPPRDARDYFQKTFADAGIAAFDDVVAGCHCMTPSYLRHQLETSLSNLGVETIDIYYVHNPEMQTEEVSREAFYERLEAAFAQLEKSVKDGKIQFYGTATWNGYRAHPEDSEYLELRKIVDAAKKVGGDKHHFRFVQLPYNLGMVEAFGLQNQPFGSRKVSLLQAAKELGLNVIGSATLLQRRLVSGFPTALQKNMPGLATDAQRAIQFARSSPGLTASLVGMSSVRHVRENLETAKTPPLNPDQLKALFQQA
ncbi:MAG: aldo/keto reductase [bacterium]